MIFTYFGVFGIIIYLLYTLFTKSVPLVGELSWGILLIAILIPAILFIRKFRFVAINSFWDKFINYLISIIFIVILILSITVLPNSENFQIANFINLEGFGIPGLIALILLPLFWQFVDLTNWQRLLSVELSNSEDEFNSNIKNGLLNFSIESPFTWILFLSFGLLIVSAFPTLTFEDILIDFPRLMIQSSVFFEQVIGYLFIVSIISIMLSTIDSFFMGIAFTFVYDINKKSRILIDSGNTIDQKTTKSILMKGKYFGFISVILALYLFIFFDNSVVGGGDLFINLLLTFYSAALSFLPLVLGMIFLKKLPNPIFAILSILLSSLIAISVGVYSVLYDPTYAWYPIILTISISSIIYFIGLLSKKGEVL